VVTANGFCVKRETKRGINPDTSDLDAEIVSVKIKGEGEEQKGHYCLLSVAP
jgi:hypothetical protein